MADNRAGVYERNPQAELDDPEQHLFVPCCCDGPAHCWFCGKAEAEHMTEDKP